MSTPLLVGGLGGPHDRWVAAVLTARGRPAIPLGPFDGDALERGRAALPRGQCAPMLYTTGALLRAAQWFGSRPWSHLHLLGCGPCRYAPFALGWDRALGAGTNARREAVPQSPDGLLATLGAPLVNALLEALACADVIAEAAHRLRPYVRDPEGIDRALEATTIEVARRIEGGASPTAALHAERRWHVGLTRRPPAPLARAVLIGEPWSLHVDGDGRLNLPRVLARAGVEVEVPPSLTWFAYLLWQARQPAWGRNESPRPDACDALEQMLRSAFRQAAEAGGLRGFTLPDLDELAAYAAPHLPRDWRGGYGHVELGLAVRARVERRAHVVLSVKSFGCIPSSGVADAIVPTALGSEVPFLALEVCGDGEAARESRLMLRVASALDAAERELVRACSLAGLDPKHLPPELVTDPLDGTHAQGPRPHACTLACDVTRAALSMERIA